MNFLKKNALYIIVVLSSVLYYWFAYQTERTEFYKILILWSLLFGSYYLLTQKDNYSVKSLVFSSVLFRLLFLLAIPNLSQDFYRFIWDGRMLFEGLNPYLSLPKNFIESGNYPIAEAEALYAGMGTMNGGNFTNYPPINQLCFFIAALFSSKSIFGAVVVMRILIILADIGILYFGYKLLQNINKNPKLIFLYVLNPFIIIELVGNLHFEPVMLFFLVWSLYLLQQKKWFFAAIVFGCSVNVKLIPLLFLPIFLKWFVTDEKNRFIKKNSIQLILFYAIVIGTNLLLFSPFFSLDFIANYTNSVGLWFRNFEFNASFYYIFREIGYWFRGYNEIAIIGKITPILSVIFLLIMSFFRKNRTIESIVTSMLLALSFYYFMTTTMHPWYLSTLVILSVFTKYRYAFIWSLVIILSYHAYANNPWKENLWIVALEYFIVFLFLIFDLTSKRRISSKDE